MRATLGGSTSCLGRVRLLKKQPNIGVAPASYDVIGGRPRISSIVRVMLLGFDLTPRLSTRKPRAAVRIWMWLAQTVCWKRCTNVSRAGFHVPNRAVLYSEGWIFPQPGGGFLRVEVLHTVLGLDAKDLARTVNLEIQGMTARIPLPHLILKAKLANAALIDQEGRQEPKPVAVSVSLQSVPGASRSGAASSFIVPPFRGLFLEEMVRGQEEDRGFRISFSSLRCSMLDVRCSMFNPPPRAPRCRHRTPLRPQCRHHAA